MARRDFIRWRRRWCASDTVARRWFPVFAFSARANFVDEVSDPHRHAAGIEKLSALLEHVLARFRPETDLFVFSNVSMDTLDYTSGKVNEGSKAIMLGLG